MNVHNASYLIFKALIMYMNMTDNSTKVHTTDHSSNDKPYKHVTVCQHSHLKGNINRTRLKLSVKCACTHVHTNNTTTSTTTNKNNNSCMRTHTLIMATEDKHEGVTWKVCRF